MANVDGGTNYVQIRPHYTASHYFLISFDPELDKLEFNIIKKQDMFSIIEKCGQYAHGTQENQGSITEQNIKNNEYLYAIRPNTKKEIDASLLCLRGANQINKPEWQWLKKIIN
jgi:hypothetical protein